MAWPCVCVAMGSTVPVCGGYVAVLPTVITMFKPTIMISATTDDAVLSYWANAFSVEETAAILGHTEAYVASVFNRADADCHAPCMANPFTLAL